jgi:hypothetical protein
MEQRRLRLGDILDDYCPRERRVTNHAIVAMIEEDVKQTRCTTCDAEHAYKGARVPKRRKKDMVNPSADLVSRPEPVAEDPQILMQNDNHDEDPQAPGQEPSRAEPNTFDLPDTRIADAPPGEPPIADAPSDGPVHRPLIRATLPRPDGQKDARPVPEFTVRHSPARGNGQGNGGNYRGERVRMRGGNGNANGPNGNRGQSAGGRFHGNRPNGPGRQQMGRGGQSGFRNGSGGPNGKRGRSR